MSVEFTVRVNSQTTHRFYVLNIGPPLGVDPEGLNGPRLYEWTMDNSLGVTQGTIVHRRDAGLLKLVAAVCEAARNP